MSGGVRSTVLVTSPGSKTMLEGTATTSVGMSPWRNPPGSSTETPTITLSVVVLPRVSVKVRVSPSVIEVEFVERVMVGWSSSMMDISLL